eukprot:scaffold339873_cov28-Attheya_sp.AAC.1
MSKTTTLGVKRSFRNALERAIWHALEVAATANMSRTTLGKQQSSTFRSFTTGFGKCAWRRMTTW